LNQAGGSNSQAQIFKQKLLFEDVFFPFEKLTFRSKLNRIPPQKKMRFELLKTIMFFLEGHIITKAK